MDNRHTSQDEHYKLLLNSVAEGVFELDILGNCVFCNIAAAKMIGYQDQSDLTGRNISELIHSIHDDCSGFPVGEGKITEAFLSEKDQHVEDELICTKDGQSFPIEYWLSPIRRKGKLVGSVVTFLDNTERRKCKQELLSGEHRLKGVIEGTNVGTWEWNVQTGDAVYNERWAEIVGYTLEELSPVSINTWTKLAHPDDLLESEAQLMQLFIRQISYYDLECRMRHKNGNWIWVHDRGKVIEWTTDGKPLLAAGTHSNINARKEIELTLLENEIRLQDLNATKDKFLSIIAHDLRSPFNTIVGFSELLLGKIKIKEYSDIEDYARNILTSSYNTLNLLANLLEWARSQTNMIAINPEYFDISQLIDEIVKFSKEAATQKQISIQKIMPTYIMVFADRQMIGTIIRNLLSNALKFTDMDGKIIIYVKNISQGVTVEIKDNGVGIRAETIKKLFRIDQSVSKCGTRNEKGTGLGLILCKEFVEKHGGKIQVKSEVGEGSIFSFYIPSKESGLNQPKLVC